MTAAASAFFRSATWMWSSSLLKKSPTVSLILSQLPGSSGISRLAWAIASDMLWRVLAASLA
ncbi:hypothetical protein HS99_0022465 [Kitasatospora aureofaciens]|uniref:Uncharacterized protein n=1 Tax=Kitasatospora aureofaciens TaxID=1894 RepID=A0A1E7NC81_KITAU|nr:hypothetical protein B6264_15805 [Kitasatospora aureofaciens]OEV38301.1 hypothetical protein HS99_0022465 [Kitasatospora aureofaciens]